MDVKSLLWYGVLLSVTGAYVIAMAGVRSARRHDVSRHSRLMVASCSVVGLWLVAYVSKQVVFGRDAFGGTPEQYWRWYVPLLLTHTVLAVSTIGLGSYNLYTGLRRLQRGSVGAMAAGAARHRLIGLLLVGTFSGTMVTAYLVYVMLFVWFPAS
ncbi:MAG: DUF420 domain-containing protein [Nitrospirota bacterium]